MKPIWYWVFWWLLVGGGAACMAVFAYATWAYLGWGRPGDGLPAGELSFEQLVSLLMVMPAGLLWMAAIFPAMQIHYHTGSRATIYITVFLLAVNLSTLTVGALYL